MNHALLARVPGTVSLCLALLIGVMPVVVWADATLLAAAEPAPAGTPTPRPTPPPQRTPTPTFEQQPGPRPMPGPTPAPQQWVDPAVDKALAAIDSSLSAAEKGLRLQALGPVFNAGGDIAKSSKPLQNPTTRRQVGQLFLGGYAPYSAKYNRAFNRLTSGLEKTGGALEKYGKFGDVLDKAANLSEGMGSLYEKDWVGVAQTGANTGLSNGSALGGAWLGAKGGAAVGGSIGATAGGIGAVPGAAIGGVIGGISGAIAASYAYDNIVKPELDKAMDNVSAAMQNRAERVISIYRRIETDRTLLEQNRRPPWETLTGIEPAFIPRKDAELMHERAEQIRAQQMADRVQENSADNIGDRVDLLKTLRSKSDDPEATEKLANEIALLEQRLQQLPLADVLKRVDALNAMRDKTNDLETRQKLEREIAFLNQRDRPPQDRQPVNPVVPAAVPSSARTTAPTPLAPCTGLNEIRNSAGICLCRPGTELVLGRCQPFCPANMVRDSAGICGCMQGYESVGGICLPACLPIEERIGNVCMARCGANEERNAQNICVCRPGHVPTAKGCAPACGPNETRDNAGTCVCSADFERVNGQCVPFCGPGEVRAPDGSCGATNACVADSDCPAGFECGPQKVCLDKRPAGDAAVRMLQSAREARSQPDRLQLPLYGQTATGRPERFGLSQMPGGSTQIPTPSTGTVTTSPQQPHQAGTATLPSDIACGAGGRCPSGYTCNSGTGVCVKQPTVTSSVAIPTCTTDRDCPGAKCVNNVCTSAPPTSVAPPTPVAPPTTTVSTPQGSWYLFESAFTYTDEQRKQRCVSTNRWALQYRTLAEAQAFLKKLGDETLKTVHDVHPEATLVSTRIVSGPTTTMPALPGGQGGIVSVRCQ